MELRFNSACPHHIGRCKCSLKRNKDRKQQRASWKDRGDTSQPRTSSDSGSETDTMLSIRHVPTNVYHARVSRLVTCIQNLGLDCTPVVYLPSRIGQSEMMDTAVEALTHLAMGTVRESNARVFSNLVSSKYSRSMTLLRGRLQTWDGESELDALVGTVTLLGVIAVVTRDTKQSKSQSCKEFFTHWIGVSNMLLSSCPSAAKSEVARASMASAACSTFAIPCFQGTASPYEAGHWLRAEPADLHATTSELRALNACSHQLSVRLPRLIVLLRQLREKSDAGSLDEARALSRELYACREEDAEEWLLHRVKVVWPQTHDETQALIPLNLEFASVREMTAAILYWQSRIISTRIENLLQATSNVLPWSITDPTGEETRLVNNIMTAWPYGKSAGFCATAPFTLGLVTVWLIARDQPTFHSLPSGRLESWILQTLDITQGGWAIGETTYDLDAACDVLMGGPLVGRLADLVRPFEVPTASREQT